MRTHPLPPPDSGASFSSFGVFVFEIWVLRFRSRVLRFRDLGVFVFDLGCFVFEFWVLHFRDMGASCFGLRFRLLRFRNYPYGAPTALWTTTQCTYHTMYGPKLLTVPQGAPITQSTYHTMHLQQAALAASRTECTAPSPLVYCVVVYPIVYVRSKTLKSN